MASWRTVFLSATLVCVVGCAGQSPLTSVGPEPPMGFRAGEVAKGSACGTLVAAFIPTSGVNTRVERAYKEALGNRGKGLTDTRIRDYWRVVPGALILCTEIEGKVIQ
jgi:hypothetical protein